MDQELCMTYKGTTRDLHWCFTHSHCFTLGVTSFEVTKHDQAYGTDYSCNPAQIYSVYYGINSDGAHLLLVCSLLVMASLFIYWSVCFWQFCITECDCEFGSRWLFMALYAVALWEMTVNEKRDSFFSVPNFADFHLQSVSPSRNASLCHFCKMKQIRSQLLIIIFLCVDKMSLSRIVQFIALPVTPFPSLTWHSFNQNIYHQIWICFRK